jgi:hypothetical protein
MTAKIGFFSGTNSVPNIQGSSKACQRLNKFRVAEQFLVTGVVVIRCHASS